MGLNVRIELDIEVAVRDHVNQICASIRLFGIEEGRLREMMQFKSVPTKPIVAVFTSINRMSFNFSPD